MEKLKSAGRNSIHRCFVPPLFNPSVKKAEILKVENRNQVPDPEASQKSCPSADFWLGQLLAHAQNEIERTSRRVHHAKQNPSQRPGGNPAFILHRPAGTSDHRRCQGLAVAG